VHQHAAQPEPATALRCALILGPAAHTGVVVAVVVVVVMVLLLLLLPLPAHTA
jgi:hypothetical protein